MTDTTGTRTEPADEHERPTVLDEREDRLQMPMLVAAALGIDALCGETAAQKAELRGRRRAP